MADHSKPRVRTSLNCLHIGTFTDYLVPLQPQPTPEEIEAYRQAFTLFVG